jgi:hypothetical protein
VASSPQIKASDTFHLGLGPGIKYKVQRTTYKERHIKYQVSSIKYTRRGPQAAPESTIAQLSKMSGLQKCLHTFSPSTTVLFAVGGLYLLYTLAQNLVTYYRRQQIIREKGCKPYAQYPHKDPLGLDLTVEIVGLAKKGGLWDRAAARYTEINGGVTTFGSKFMGRTIVNTIEPENIKAVLSTQFKEFQFSKKRKDALCPVIGHGIFTTDGKEWEESRALLRPNFARSQLVDLDKFEKHIQNLIARIPKDRSTVDIQELFFMLTMDSGKPPILASSFLARFDLLNLSNSDRVSLWNEHRCARRQEGNRRDLL